MTNALVYVGMTYTNPAPDNESRDVREEVVTAGTDYESVLAEMTAIFDGNVTIEKITIVAFPGGRQIFEFAVRGEQYARRLLSQYDTNHWPLGRWVSLDEGHAMEVYIKDSGLCGATLYTVTNGMTDLSVPPFELM